MSRAPRVLALAVGVLAAAAPAHAAGPHDRLLAPAGRCEPQADRAAKVAAQERAMRCLINHARRAAGVRLPLRKRRKLMTSADHKAADILSCGTFSHTACGRPFTHHMQQVGYANGCFGAAENIAWGSGALGTARSIMRAWLRSDGHRANIVDGRHRAHGVALRAGTLSGHAGAAVWVHQLGHRC